MKTTPTKEQEANAALAAAIPAVRRDLEAAIENSWDALIEARDDVKAKKAELKTAKLLASRLRGSRNAYRRALKLLKKHSKAG